MGKFSQPRNRRAEEREMEETFRRLTKSEPESLPREPEVSPRPTEGKYAANSAGKHTSSTAPKKNMALLISLCSAAAIVLIAVIITVVVMFGNFGDDGNAGGNQHSCDFDCSGVLHGNRNRVWIDSIDEGG